MWPKWKHGRLLDASDDHTVYIYIYIGIEIPVYIYIWYIYIYKFIYIPPRNGNLLDFFELFEDDFYVKNKRFETLHLVIFQEIFDGDLIL